MSASFRSHFRAQPPKEPPTHQRERLPANRSLAKPRSNDEDGHASSAIPHVSKQAKRSSKSIATANSTRSTSSAPAVRAHSIIPASAKVASEAAQHRSTRVPIPSHLPIRNVSSPSADSQPPAWVPRSIASPVAGSRSLSLRRKPSTIEQYAASRRGVAITPISNSRPVHGEDVATERASRGGPAPDTSSLGTQSWIDRADGASPALLPAQNAVLGNRPMSRTVTPSMTDYARTATPSTRYADSPFSRAPTVSSASSFSPATTATTSTSRPWSRPPSVDRESPQVRAHPANESTKSRLALPPVRESSTSSSNSTTKSLVPTAPRAKRDAASKAVPTAGTPAPGVVTGSVAGNASKESQRPVQAALKLKPPATVPPELAHLAVDNPPSTTLSRPYPPLRPSREGTPLLAGMNGPSPVVHSDLPRLYTTYHKRAPSQETPTSATSPTFKTIFGLSPRSASKQSSPRIDSAISPPPAARSFIRDPSPESRAVSAPRLTRKDSPAIVPAPSKSPRFGFLSRKPKATEIKPAEKPQRRLSKGPSAGTGHEGYGRFGSRSRVGSASSGSSIGAGSSSVGSTVSSQQKGQTPGRKGNRTSKSGSDMDDFLRDRLSPVVLRGSGSTFSNTTTTSDVQSSSAAVSSYSSSMDFANQPQLLPSAIDHVPNRGVDIQELGLHRTAVVNREEHRSAHIASAKALQHAVSKSAERSTGTTAKAHLAMHADRTSLDDSGRESVAQSQTASDRLHGDAKRWLQPGMTDPPSKLPRKWSFFQRVHATPRDKGKLKHMASLQRPDASQYEHSHRATAHYAVSSEQSPTRLEDVERIMMENETSAEESMSESGSRVNSRDTRRASLLPMRLKREPSSTFDLRAGAQPPRITIRPESEDSTELMRAEETVAHQAPHVVNIKRSPSLHQTDPWADQKAVAANLKAGGMTEVVIPDMMQAPFAESDSVGLDGTIRQPRLSPIGRIPKVVSKRDRELKLSDHSFSRPFIPTRARSLVKPPGSLYTQIREHASPVEPAAQPVFHPGVHSGHASSAVEQKVDTPMVNERAEIEKVYETEFISFPSRKDSDVSYSSSSGENSVRAILATPPQEDDVWNEYNEWLDEVARSRPPEGAMPLGASHHNPRVQYEVSPLLGIQGQARSISQSRLPEAPVIRTGQETLSVPEQVARSLRSPMSMSHKSQAPSDVAGYYRSVDAKALNYHRASIAASSTFSASQSNRSSAQDGMNASVRDSHSTGHSRSASLPEATLRNSQASLTPSIRFDQHTALSDIAEADGNEQQAMANIRFAALMTSKCLSSDRVLISPAHKEMGPGDDARVLVLDGLGSDWSFYIALSFPAATVYNLGPKTASRMSDWPGVSRQPPPNHQQISHAAISAAFPFPKGFFTVVILRFPGALTHQAYQACILECKRVLKPAGFIEIVALDLDLLKMGNRARKAIRGLKTRMQEHDPSINLQNVDDIWIRLLGRRGFEHIQQNIFGLSVARGIQQSQDMHGASYGGSGLAHSVAADRRTTDSGFANILEVPRAGQVGHDSKGSSHGSHTMPEVGRWWYSTCFEQPPWRSTNSIWNNPDLLRECEEKDSAFKIFICCAQKPAQLKRRTVSV